MSAWLAGRYGRARGSARELVRVAHALRELPAIRSTLARSELCMDQLKPLTRFVTPDEDALWAQKAPSMSPAQLWAECRRRERRSREEVQTDSQLRYFWMGWDENRRTLHLQGELPAVQGTALEAALERAAEDISIEDDVRDLQGARLADALVGLVSSGADGVPQPVVVVHTDVSTLGGESGIAETDRVCRSRLRRLSASRARQSSSGWWRPAGCRSGSAGGRATSRHGSEGRSYIR